MKKIILMAAVVLASVVAHAQTTISSSTVSGHWTLAGSPYLIANSFIVWPDSSLTIDPGVEVVFQGYYKIQIDGNLIAAGTDSLPILFHAQDTTGWADTSTAGGWAGIQLGNYPVVSTSASVIRHCNFTDIKRTGLNAMYVNLAVEYCNFTHNNGFILYEALPDSTMTFELSNCNFYKNYVPSPSYIAFTSSGGTLYIHDCSFHDDTTAASLMDFAHNTLIFEHNQVYANQQTASEFATSVETQYCNGVIAHNKIHHNLSQFDAALACTIGIYDINGNLICNNATITGIIGSSACGSVEGGGGIRISGEGAAQPTNFLVRNNVVANNYAALQGGGIDVFLTNATIVNNDFYNNRGLYGGGIFIFNDTFTNGHTLVDIRNNIFNNNITLSAGASGLPDTTIAVWITNGDTMRYTNNWTKNTFSKDYFLEGGLMGGSALYVIGDTASNVIGTDPLLVAPTLTATVTEDATLANFALQDSSGCIDNGDNTAFADSVDYALNTRIIGARIDIGAYESAASHTLAVGPHSPMMEGLTVYPNPAHDNFLIATPEAAGIITVTDIAGRDVARKPVSASQSRVDVTNLAPGLYLMVWQDGKGRNKVAKVEVK